MKKIYTSLVLTLLISLNSFSQCDDDRHSTNWFDGWVACSSSINPNPDRGDSYWVHYDLGETYTLGQTHFWNYNDPNHVNYGLKTIAIDYSMDGINWTEAGVHMLLQASGRSDYEGADAMDLHDIEARYLIITAIDNWGGACYGLSELKIELGESSSPIISLPAVSCLEVEVYPNPATSYSSMAINSDCDGAVSYTIMNAFGSELYSITLGEIDYKKLALPISDLSAGVYYIIVNQNNSSEKIKLVVL